MPGPKSKRRLLHKGMGGEDVRDVQRKLNARRVNVLDEAGKRARPLEVDGNFGTDTEKAVRLFQGRNHLEPNGNVDDRTWDALNTVLAVATVTAEPRPKFGSLLNHMLDEAEKGLKGRDGRISLRMRQPGSERNTPGPYLRPPDSIRPIPGGDRIYQIQGQQGRVLQPFPTGPFSRALQIAATWRTSQEDRHWERGPFLQLQQNFIDPKWQIQAGVSVLYADLVHLGPWHLASFYTQPTLTLPLFHNHWGLSLPIGYQASVDLTEHGNLGFFVQGQVAASIDLNTWQISTAAGAVMGLSINIPSDLPKSLRDFWRWL